MSLEEHGGVDVDKSILKETKKLLGIMGDYDAFDTDIIVYINSAFSVLNQLGVGPDTPFSISDYNALWGDFAQDDFLIPLVKEYIYLKTKKIFEASSLTSYAMSAIDGQIAELEFRMNVACDLREVDEDV